MYNKQVRFVRLYGLKEGMGVFDPTIKWDSDGKSQNDQANSGSRPDAKCSRLGVVYRQALILN